MHLEQLLIAGTLGESVGLSALAEVPSNRETIPAQLRSQIQWKASSAFKINLVLLLFWVRLGGGAGEEDCARCSLGPTELLVGEFDSGAQATANHPNFEGDY
jgi:hypothetical protein